MMFGINSKDIKDLHTTMLANKDHALLKANVGAIYYITENHKCNMQLWAEEDLARRPNVTDNEIARNKRNIDKYNQQRNNFIEEIDVCILSAIPKNHQFTRDPWINSETAGSIIDRMSIASLRHFNMNKQLMRKDADENHIQQCQAKLSILQEQMDNLGTCLDNLLIGIENGTATYRIYKQLKMYNDPTLNPYLYAK